MVFPKIAFPAEFSTLRAFATELALRGDSSLQVGVSAGSDKAGRPIGLSFYFDKGLNCQSASSGDGLQFLLETLAKEGKIEFKPDLAYFSRLCSEVEYWDGERFVRQPTIRRSIPALSAK